MANMKKCHPINRNSAKHFYFKNEFFLSMASVTPNNMQIQKGYYLLKNFGEL